MARSAHPKTSWWLAALVGLMALTPCGCGINASSTSFSPATQSIATTASLPLLSIQVISASLTNPGVHLQFDVQNAGGGVQGLYMQVVRHDSTREVGVQNSIMNVDSGTAQTVHIYDSPGQPGSNYTITLDPQHKVQQDPRSNDSAQATAPMTSNG